MKRQQDSLAERLMSAGFIADLGVSGSTRAPASPSRTRQDSEDTEQVRDSEVTTPEVNLMSLSPSQASLPRRPAQRPEYFQMSPEEDSRLRSSHGSHGSHGSQDGVDAGASDAEVCQQSFVLSPGRHLRPAGAGVVEEGTLPAPPLKIEPGKDRSPEAADTVVLRASRDSLSSISRNSEVRQSPEPHPIPHPSPSFGWKEMQNHKFRAWLAEFEPVPPVPPPPPPAEAGSGFPASTYRPVEREARGPPRLRPQLRPTEPVCLPASPNVPRGAAAT